MSKTVAPIMSFEASGQLGKSLVYANWKGVRYARRYTVPSNPKTTAQVNVRKAFTFAHELFKYMGADIQDAWNAYAKGQPFTGPNAFSQANIADFIGASNLNSLITAKPVGGGPPTPSLVLTPGSGQIGVAPGVPTLPAGWTLTKSILFVIKNLAPTDEANARIGLTFSVSSSPWSHTFTGLTAAQAYQCSAFFQMTRADGMIAYGGSINGVATPT
jgi:hypothetical protein